LVSGNGSLLPSAEAQYYWTGQKLIMHGLIAVLSLLLGGVLLRRAQRGDYRGSLRSLIHQLSRIHMATMAEHPAGRRWPQVHPRTEECDPQLRRLAQALGAVGD
jgi:hypothetical protein